MRYITLNLVFFFALIAYGQTPTVPASNITFSFTGCNEAEISWTNGNGGDRVVFMIETGPISDVPEYDEFYTDNPKFGLGESIKTDGKHFCVYKGPGNSVKVKGLKKLTKYCVAVFEYNGGGGSYDYKTDAYPTACITTKSIVADFSKDKPSCLHGNVLNYKNKSTSDVTPMTYLWKFSDATTSSTKDPNHTYTNAGIQSVLLTITAQGCSTSVALNDTIHPNPVAKFDYESNDTVQCWYNNLFTFKNKSTLEDVGAGVSYMRYEWYEIPPGEIVATSYKGDIRFKTDGKKTLKLVAISNMGCRDSMSMSGFTIKPRAIDMSKTSVDPHIKPLKNNSFKFTTTYTKTWQIRGKSDPSFKDSTRGMSVNYSFPAVGWYYVSFDTLDTKTGCYDKFLDSITIIKDAGAISKNALETISIYPNPSKSGIFTITDLPASASIKVYSIIGQELLNLNQEQSNSEFNLEKFGAGTYILSMWSEGRKFDYRLVVL